MQVTDLSYFAHIWHTLVLGWFFTNVFDVRKVESLGMDCVTYFDRTPACDRHTDGHSASSCDVLLTAKVHLKMAVTVDMLVTVYIPSSILVHANY